VETVSFGPMRLGLPDPASLVPDAMALTALAVACLFALQLGLVRTLAATAVAGLIGRALTGG
jgi:chromate transporter